MRKRSERMSKQSGVDHLVMRFKNIGVKFLMRGVAVLVAIIGLALFWMPLITGIAEAWYSIKREVRDEYVNWWSLFTDAAQVFKTGKPIDT